MAAVEEPQRCWNVCEEAFDWPEKMQMQHVISEPRLQGTIDMNSQKEIESSRFHKSVKKFHSESLHQLQET